MNLLREGCTSQAFTTHHPNVFTPILSLSEGRAGIAWVPSNKMFFLSPSDIKRLSLFPQILSLYFYSSTILPYSLSLSLSLRLQKLYLGREYSLSCHFQFIIY
jgi:hypothetical protein